MGFTISISQLAISPTGLIDTSFNTGTGFNDSVYTVKIDSNGKTYVGGAFTTYTGSSQNRLIKLNSDGTKDTSFNIGTGFTGGLGILYSTTFDSSGKIYAGGAFIAYSGSTQNYLVKLDTNGSIDTSFNTGTGFNNEVYSIDIDSNGKLIIGGLFTTYSGSTQNYLTKLNTNGSIDTSFNIGTGFNAQAYIVKIDSNGKILVGGNFTTYSGSTQNYLIRLNSDGTKDTSFNIGTGFNGAVKSIDIDSSGKIYVGGFFTTYSGSTQNRIVRINTSGSIDTSFNIGTGFNNAVESLNIDSTGKIYVGGNFTTYSGSTENYLIKLNSNGTKDTSFNTGTGFNDQVRSTKIDSSGKIYVGGFFTAYSGSTQNRLVRLT